MIGMRRECVAAVGAVESRRCSFSREAGTMSRNTAARRPHRSLFFVALAAVITASGCAGTGINSGDFNLISVEEEWQLGAQLHADIVKQMRVMDRGEIQSYVTRMGRTILEQAAGEPIAQQPWTFHIIDDPQVNAFNIPGGHVYLYAGLVAQTDDYAELMSVMGHEVSHGLARHAVENLSKSYGLSVVAGILLGNNPAIYEEILASILAGGAVIKFSRDAEREADRLGVQYMHDAGIDPRGAADMLRKLIALRGRQPGALERLTSTHPLTEERVSNVEALIAKLPPKSVRRSDPGFAAFKRAVASATTASR
jgi:predicted Zn-dependent protease